MLTLKGGFSDLGYPKFLVGFFSDRILSHSPTQLSFVDRQMIIQIGLDGVKHVGFAGPESISRKVNLAMWDVWGIGGYVVFFVLYYSFYQRTTIQF